MAEQVQCPNCRGYKVIVLEKEKIKEKHELTGSDRRRWWLMLGIVFTVVFGLCGIMGLWMPNVFENAFRNAVIGTCCIWILVIVLLATGKKPVVDLILGYIYHFECQLCGFRWHREWRKGQPLLE